MHRRNMMSKIFICIVPVLCLFFIAKSMEEAGSQPRGEEPFSPHEQKIVELVVAFQKEADMIVESFDARLKDIELRLSLLEYSMEEVKEAHKVVKWLADQTHERYTNDEVTRGKQKDDD